MPARIASLDANVIVVRGVVVTDLVGILFSTTRADNTSEGPTHQARRANEIPSAAVGRSIFDLKHTDLRFASAEWTAILNFDKVSIRLCARLVEPACVRLQKSLREELNIGGCLPILDQHSIDLALTF